MACMINSDRALQTVETLIGYNANLNGNDEVVNNKMIIKIVVMVT